MKSILDHKKICAITHNVSHVCDVALSPTRAKGHVAERRAAAPRSPSRPEGAAMYIRAVMGSCVFEVTPDISMGYVAVSPDHLIHRILFRYR
jgi:hypothetical protein